MEEESLLSRLYQCPLRTCLDNRYGKRRYVKMWCIMPSLIVVLRPVKNIPGYQQLFWDARSDLSFLCALVVLDLALSWIVLHRRCLLKEIVTFTGPPFISFSQSLMSKKSWTMYSAMCDWLSKFISVAYRQLVLPWIKLKIPPSGSFPIKLQANLDFH